MPRRNAERQRSIDYSKRGKDLRAIRNCRVGDPLEKLLLRTLDDRIGDGTHWTMTMSELASEMEVARSTLYAKVRSLADKRLISVDDVDGDRKRFQLIRSNIDGYLHPRPQRRRVRHPESGSRTHRPRCDGSVQQMDGSVQQTDGSVQQMDGHSIERPISAQSAPRARTVARAEYDRDELIFKSEFIASWNELEGVAPHGMHDLPYRIDAEFRERLDTPGWYERARLAFLKFPLESGCVISLRKFLEPTTVDEILGGVHDFESNRPHQPSRAERRERSNADAFDVFLATQGVREGNAGPLRLETDD